MKFIEFFKRADSKKRVVSVVCFTKDGHLFKQFSKKMPFEFISESKCFYNRVRCTGVFTNENPYIKTANLSVDTIILDDHLNNAIIEFIKTSLKNNKKITILCLNRNKKLESNFKVKLAKKEYIEYFF
ncbi:MAG: hypothetical protein ACRCXX_14090 [Cetobacterium sp.]|uniref:hypothetical protein n=1 Tax=Cetobacterium sp. TaxID=2071632 RepID=UPI003F2BC838